MNSALPKFKLIIVHKKMEKQDNTFHYAKDGCVIEYNPNQKIVEKSIY